MKVSFDIGIQHRHLEMTVVLILAISPLGIMPAAAQGTINPDLNLEASPTDYNNWLTLGAGGTFVGGDKAQFEHELDTKTGIYGGVQDFHWQQFVGKSGLFTVDGKAIAANHDYSLTLGLSNPNLGYFRAGASEYRTWYDGNGGFFPQNNQSFSLYDNQLHIDRGSVWVETGLTQPDKPAVTLRYEHDYRLGQMDSTSWGDTSLTGGFGTRNIVPTFQNIDETRDIVKADVKDTLGNTDLGLGLRYEIDRSHDSLYIDRMPGSTANRYVTQVNDEQDEMFNAHGFTKTRFNDMVTFSTGASFTTLDSDLSGSRIYGPSYNSPYSSTYANSQSRDEGFTGLGGGGNTKDYVANMNLMITPCSNLVFVAALRMEYEGDDLSDNFSANNVATTGGAAVSTPTAESDSNWYLDLAESLEARYTGFRNWSLYAKGEWSEDSGNEIWNETTAIVTPVLNQDWSMLGQKYTLGANWYPLYRLNFSAQYYHQEHKYDYDNNLTATPTTYPGYLQDEDFKVDDINIRATWRVLNTLSLVTRYDFQYSTVDTTSIPDGGALAGEVQSANITSHVINENISWTPISRLYVQVGGSYVLDNLDTPAANLAGVTNLVLNSANNYWTADATAGYALNKKTDLKLQYSYYRADDYVNNSAFSQPYGAGDEQNRVTATITRRISKTLQVSLKYAFFRNRDETSGGLDNYNAQLVYLSMRYQF